MTGSPHLAKHLHKAQNLLPQKFEDSSEYWHIYLSSAPRIWAPTPVKRGPCCATCSALNFLGKAGLSTEYMKQKLCCSFGIDTLKYHPSKNFPVLPSKWYLKQLAKDSKRRKKSKNESSINDKHNCATLQQHSLIKYCLSQPCNFLG